jgi:hypothetical protein
MTEKFCGSNNTTITVKHVCKSGIARFFRKRGFQTLIVRIFFGIWSLLSIICVFFPTQFIILFCSNGFLFVYVFPVLIFQICSLQRMHVVCVFFPTQVVIFQCIDSFDFSDLFTSKDACQYFWMEHSFYEVPFLICLSSWSISFLIIPARFWTLDLDIAYFLLFHFNVVTLIIKKPSLIHLWF